MFLKTKQIKNTLILSGIFLFLSVSLVLADSERDIAVDMAIGGMKEGSRILDPSAGTGIHGNHLSSGMDARSITSISQSDKSSAGAVAGGIFPGGSSQNINFPSETGANPVNAPLDTGGTGVSGTGEITSGNTGGSGSTTTTDTTSDSGSAIITVDLQADLDSGTVDAGLGVDTSADKLLDADVSGTTSSTTGTVEADIGSVSDITGEDMIAVTEPLETVLSPESSLIGEVDVSAETVASEPEVGIEADVDGVSAGEDIVADPADGIATGL